MSEEKYGHEVLNKKFNIEGDNLIGVVNNNKWKKSEIIEFTIKFNGEAMESNEIEADDLATSLSGLSGVLEESNILLNGSSSKMLIKVRGSFKPGSFIVDIATFFTSDGINATVNVLELLGFIVGSSSLLWFFKRTKGGKILTKKQIQGNNYEVSVNESDSPTIINGDVILLYEDVSIREELRKFTHPLNNKGISDIAFLMNEKECEKIYRYEREYFTTFERESVNEKEDIDYFLITQSNFEGKQTGWRLSFGDSIATKNRYDFSARILDEKFLKKVKYKKIVISSDGTIIKAKYKKTTQKLERLSVNWEILEVLSIDHTTEKHTSTLTKFINNS